MNGIYTFEERSFLSLIAPRISLLGLALNDLLTSATMKDLGSVSTIDLQKALEGISIPSSSPRAVFSNWAKTFECRPQRVFAPTMARECQMIVELAGREDARIHPVGVGHSPSDLACTNGWLVRMEGVKGLVRVSHPVVIVK